MKRVLPVILIIIAPTSNLLLSAVGQTTHQTPEQNAASGAGVIKGRVVNEAGTPLPNARVFVNSAGRQTMRRAINTDENGRFVADELPRGNYIISVQADGYTQVREPGTPGYYRPGDIVNLTLKKGGVITGTVMTADGEPVILVAVSATQILDEFGRKTGTTSGLRYTDDRGVYRIFGLQAGTYIVAAASKAVRSGGVPAYDDNVATYYPSTNRSAAAEIVVQSGAETTGIDIRFRGETGYTISGTLIDRIAPEGFGVVGLTSVVAMRTSDDMMEAQNMPRYPGNENTFSIYGVPDGDYYLIARRASYQGYDGAESKRVPVKVRGHDVTGIAVNLDPLGSVAGRLALDIATRNQKCETTRMPAIEETLVAVRSEDSDEKDSARGFSSAASSPDKQGDFMLQGLSAGRYRIDSRTLLDESWYIKGITVPSPTNTPSDAGGGGIIVRSGQRTTGVRVVLGEGAATIRGMVLPEKETGSIPNHLRLYLVPSELVAAENLLRYLEADVQTDGTFKVLNVAPGKYWLLARQLSEEDLKMRIPTPQSWKSANRAALRREASAANVTIELKPCQRVSDFQLRYSPSKEEIRPKRQ